jgi:DNA-binding transcriptional MocR family regulator
VAETLETGELQRYIYQTLQPSYGSRYRKMIAAINKELIPLGVELPQTDREVVGGYFIWLTLPQPLKGAAVAQRAKDEENVVVAQGESKTASDSQRHDSVYARHADSVHSFRGKLDLQTSFPHLVGSTNASELDLSLGCRGQSREITSR